MFLLLLSIIIALILGLEDIEFVSQHSLIDLKYHYISYLNKYGFAISNNQNGNLILQPFQNIEYLYICKDINKVYDPENYCNRINNLTANTDNFLGLYSQIDYLIFLFNTSEFQMKYFFDKSPYSINIDDDSNFKCFDFFAGYSNLLFYLNSNLNYSRIVTIQFMTNVTGTIYNSTLYVVNRDSMRTLLYKNDLRLFGSYKLAYDIKYSLYYSPPNGDNIHSILCLSFRNDIYQLVTGNSQVIPIITPGYFYFTSYLEKEWNILSEYYPTTFYFYLDSTTIKNCSFRFDDSNKGNYRYCDTKKDDNRDDLYIIKIYSHKNSVIFLELFLEPKMIDENCHFGYNISFNKTVGEYDPINHFTEILEKIIDYNIGMYIAILVITACISFFPLIIHKWKCCQN